MLDEKRIKEAESNVRQYLEDNLLKKQTNETANAVLLKLGYKVGDKISHKVTADAIIVFVRNKLKKNLLEEYENAQKDALELMSQKAD